MSLPTRLRHEGLEVEEVVCYRSVLGGRGGGPRGRRARGPSWWWRARAWPSLLARASPDGRPAANARGRPHHGGGGSRVRLAAGGAWPRGPTSRRCWPAVRTLLAAD